MTSVLILLISLLCLVAGQVDNYYFSSVPLNDHGMEDIDNLYVEAVLEKTNTVFLYLGPKENATILTCDDGLAICNITFAGQNFTITVDDDGYLIGQIGPKKEYAVVEEDPENPQYSGDVYIDGYNFTCQTYTPTHIDNYGHCMIYQRDMEPVNQGFAEFRLVAEFVPSNSSQVVLTPHHNIKPLAIYSSSKGSSGGSLFDHISNRLGLLALFATLF